MKPVEFPYQNQTIHFLLNSSDDNVMVNATEMAKIFDKRTKDFLANQATKDFIAELEQTLNSVRSDEKILSNRGHVGIYFHRLLAIKFAAWLDVKFEIWIYNVINKILFGYYKEHWDAHILQEKSKAQMEEYKRKLLLDPTEENAIAYFEAEETFKSAKAKKQKAISNQYKLL